MKSRFAQPHGVIDLSECLGVMEKKDGTEFEVKTRGEKFHLRSDGERGRDEWVRAIKTAISNSLSKAQYEEKYKAILYKGARFLKYHNDPMGRFNLMNKDHNRIVKISNDGQRIVWQKPGKEDVLCDSIDLNTVMAVNPGHTTLTFKQTGKRDRESMCFSVIAKERSLDLEASSEEEARIWVEAMRALLKYGNILSPADLREADKVRLMKESGEEKKRNKALRKHENDRAKLRAARERAHKEAVGRN